MLALKLESLAHSIPLVSESQAQEVTDNVAVPSNHKLFFFYLPQQRPGSCTSAQEALQDVDDWDLTELNPDWDIEEGDASSPLPQVSLHSQSLFSF